MVDIGARVAFERGTNSSRKGDGGVSVMSRKLYLGNLPFETAESELQELFSCSGGEEKVTLVRDIATGRPRGFGFVEGYQ
jgi:RNA recognition motif-containing protein